MSSRFLAQPRIDIQDDFIVFLKHTKSDGTIEIIKSYSVSERGYSTQQRVTLQKSYQDANNDSTPDSYTVKYDINLSGLTGTIDVFLAVPMKIVIADIMVFKLEDFVYFEVPNFNESVTILADVLFKQKRILKQKYYYV